MFYWILGTEVPGCNCCSFLAVYIYTCVCVCVCERVYTRVCERERERDSSLKLNFTRKNLSGYMSVLSTQKLPDESVKYLTFPTIYVCDSRFSALPALKSKYRNKLTVQPYVRLKLSLIQLHFQSLKDVKQHQLSQ